MSLEEKRRVLEVLDRALEEEAEDRPRLVAELCPDEHTRQRVMALLEAEQPGGLLDSPVFDVHGADPAIGRQVGAYRLTQLVGRGGMGTVYLAEREEFEQQVAVKFIRRGFDLDPVVVQRFHNERQILARLEHPYIARLLDGGTTGDQLPYLVMEHVEGEAIDVYCRRLELPVAERLELFCKVCEAVHFAHQNLVVHRDLKPGNILITATGEPKLLDFGIAKLLDQGLASRPLVTATGEAPMTPRYASPEQIRRQPVTTASDVYVLGVLLFELLTGLDPYGGKTESGTGDEISRAVCDLEPERPSTAVRRRAGELAGFAERSTEKLRRRLAGDLDSIVMKAMRKEPGARYGSVERLADDIRGHLAGLPVRARTGTWSYRAGKFVRRYRLPISVAAAILLLMISAVGFYLEAKEAENKRLIAAFNIAALVRGTFARSPAQGRKEGFEALEGMPIRDRLVLAGALGELFRNLGDYATAEVFMNESLDAARKLHASPHVEIAKRMNNLAVLHRDREDYSRSIDLFGQTLEMKKRLEPKKGELLIASSNLATALKEQGSFSEALAIQEEVLAARLEMYSEDSSDYRKVATCHHNIASVHLAAGDFDAAVGHAEEALEIRASHFGADHLRAASTRDLLGRALLYQGRREEAKRELEKALQARLATFGDSHVKVAESRRNLAEAVLDEEPRRAWRLLIEALVGLLGENPESWRVADAESLESMLLLREGRLEEAEAQAEKSYRRVAKIRGESSTPARRARERWQAISRATGQAEPSRLPDARE